MKILQIVDVPYWAIGKLSASIVKFTPQFQWKVLYVHPKHVEKHLDEVKAEIEWADIIDYQYWNSCQQLMAFIPELRQKKSVLTHHNEKDLLSADWSDIGTIIVETRRSQEILSEKYPGKVKLIPLATDPEIFTYNEKLPGTKTVGYCGRIVPWKGLKEIAAACYELGYNLMVMGKPDKPDYWDSIPVEHRANMDLSYMNCPDEDRVKFYHELDVFISNSGPGRETGTLPLMEAMACGVPLITTPAGIAADICKDHENSIVVPFGDYNELKYSLKSLMEDSELQQKVRKEGWNTIKNYTEERRAWEYAKVYHEVYSPEKLVSVIIPTVPEKLGQLAENLLALNNSEHKHIEAVVVFDQCDGAEIQNVLDLSKVNYPVKALATGNKTVYGLAMSRNIGAIEAMGEYLLFCDNRLAPEPDAITTFLAKATAKDKHTKVWYFGNKGTGKKSFVENFSFIRRDQFIRAGMCNERVNRYGGMSQELRERFQSQGFALEYVEAAQAKQLSSSHTTNKRRADIVKSKVQLWKMGLN